MPATSTHRPGGADKARIPRVPATPQGCTVTGYIPFQADTRFLTVHEVAAILRVSKQTVYRLVRTGSLEAVRVGGSFRIPEHAVKPQSSSPRKA